MVSSVSTANFISGGDVTEKYIKEYKNTESYPAQRDPAQREPVGGDEPLLSPIVFSFMAKKHLIYTASRKKT